jgi:ACS family D-galactonate transporter-like MFS transporter
VVSSHTLNSHPDWRFQYHVAGWVGLAVAVIALIGLRELSPALRDQLMVSLKDRALVEARAVGLDVAEVQKDSLREMLKLDVVIPSFAISFFLVAYYIFVAFFVVYMATTFGYSEARANALASWYWVSNAIALVIAGAFSDRIRVRKPLMVVGGVISAAALAVFASKATDKTTSYYELATILSVIAAGSGIAYVAWMTAFTETVEKHNPAATATGLSLWGLIIRSVIAVVFLVLPSVVHSVGIVVDRGPRALSLQARYPTQLPALQKVDAETTAALAKNPHDAAALIGALTQVSGSPLADVLKAAPMLQQFPDELVTAKAISRTTQLLLLGDPTNAKTRATAVAEIAAGRKVSAAVAAADLVKLAAVPQEDLLYLSGPGRPVADAALALQAATAIPKADLAFLQTDGAKIQKAQRDVPGQWQEFFWIAFVGQLLFLPCAWIVTGRWSPSKARQDAEAHAAAGEAELAAIATGSAGRSRMLG